METKSMKYEIGIISDSSHDATRLSALLNAQPQFEVSIQDTEVIASMMITKWDVILYCAAVEQDVAKLVDVLAQSQRIAPCIMTFAQPTADQCVDLMQAGAYGVADWRHTERILYLINKALDARTAQQTKPVLDEQRSRYLPTVNNDLETLHTHLGAVLDGMQDALLCVGLPDRQVIFVSNAFEEVFGYPHERFTEDADFYQKIVHPDDLVRVTEAMQTCLRDGFVEVDHRVIFPDGQVRWLHRRAWINYDENGRPVRVNDSARDITARRDTQGKLDRFKNVVSSTSDGISVVNRDYVYELVNSAYLERTARAQEEIEGHHVADVMGEDVFLNLLKPELDRCMVGETIQFADWFEYAGLGKRYVSVTYSPYRDAEDVIVGVVVNTRDITEHKQAESALLASEEKYRSLIESSEAAISLVDHSGTYLYGNAIAAQPFGVQPDELIGKTVQELFPPDETASIMRDVRKVIDNGTGMVLETEVTLGGAPAWYRTSIQPVRDGDGGVYAALIFASDITQSKTAEALLRQSEAQFRQFMRHLPGAVFIKDFDEHTVYCNELYASMSGGTPADIIGKRSQDYMPADLVEAFSYENTLVKRENRAMEFNHTFPGPDGLSHWLTIKFPISREGQLPLLGAMSLDVTSEKLAEESLKRSEQRYRRMFEAVTLPKLIIDPQTARILDANAAAVDFYGYPLETLKTMTMMQINIAESEVILNKMAQVLSGEISSCIFEQRLADGTIRDVEGFATGIELNGQQTLYCTYVDMTERNRSRKALEEANQRLEQRVVERTKALREAKDRIEAIFNHSGDGIVLLDVEHGIQQTNHAFNRMFGLAEDGYFDRKLSEFVSDGYRTRLELAIQDTTIRHETRRMEIQARRADDGTTFDAEISIAPVKDSEEAVEDIVCIFRDITEQRASQAALRNSEERYRTLITTMSEGIVLQDRNGAIQAWNPAAERILGLSADQINQRTSIDPRWGTVHEDGSDFPGETHPAMVALKTGQPQSNVLMGVHRPDSVVRWLLVNAQPVFQPDHKRPVAAVTTFTDITERKTIEEALRVATERLQLATSAGQIGIWDYDAANDVMHWDEQMFKLYGVDVSQFTPSVGFWQNAVHPDDIAQAQAEAEAAARGERSHDSEFRIVTPDGEIRYLRAIANLYWDDCGRPLRTVGVNIDITEQKTAQIALRDSEERYRTFIEVSPIAVVVSDANGKIVLTNKAAEQIFGYERDELIGAPTQMLVPHEFREAHALIIKEFVSAHQHRLEAMELSARRKDGHVFPADVQLSLVNLHPAPLVMALMIDITRRKQAEETLWMALEKEKELGELKSRFVSMASHQFRTPLAAILANTETLSVYRERMDSSQIDTRLDRIRKQVLYMKDIMEDVLELARIQANQLQYQPVVGDLGALCQEIIEDFEHQEGYRDRIVYSGPENPLTAEFDPHLMHHVISNLIHNALKYSSHEQLVYVHFSQTDAGITLSVKDQGIGIQPDDLKHLFKPFYRAANVGAITGTGLGLSITKQVIDAHGGTVHVESTPESGTVFMVTLPQKDCIDDKNSRD